MKSFVLLFTLLMLAGCSRQMLDDNTASSSIERKLNGKMQEFGVQIGRVGSHCSSSDVGGNSIEFDMNPDKDIEKVVAQKAGYITIAPDGKDYWKVALTSQGQAFIDSEHKQLYSREAQKGCDFMTAQLPVARPVLVKIKQITGDDRSAEATYLWKWTLTDLGAKLRDSGSVYTGLNAQQRKDLSEHLSDAMFGFPISLPLPSEQDMNKEYEAKAQFKKSDDGWRLQ